MFDRCRQRRRDLDMYLDGTLREGPRTRLEAHIAVCGRCAGHLRAHKGMVRGSEAIRLQHVDVRDVAAFDDRVVNAVTESRQSHALQVRFGTARGKQFIAAACLAAAATAIVLAPSLRPAPSATPTALRQGTSARSSLPAPVPPVPIEDIISQPKPRNAQLWNSDTRRHAPAVRLGPDRIAAPRQHGSLVDPVARG